MQQKQRKPAQPKPARRPAVRTAPTPGVVWEAYSGPDLTFTAYVVTERADRNRVLAYAEMSADPDLSPQASARERIDCLRAAERAAADPATIEGSPDLYDCRHFCRIDSPEPMPARVYGWFMFPAGERRSARTFTLFPFCRFRLALLAARFNALTMSAAEREAYTVPAVGAFNPAGGDYLLRQLTVRPADLPAW